MHTQPKFDNFLSRLIIGSSFKYQFAVPPKRSKMQDRFLAWYEQRRMNIDLSKITIEKPIFIISLPRTGSSILQNLLSSHPQVAFFSNLMHQYHPYFCAAEHFRKRFNINVIGERYIKDSVQVELTSASDPIGVWTAWIKKDPYSCRYLPLAKKQYSQDEIDAIYADMKKVIWCFGGRARRFLMKMPGLVAYLPLLSELFPNGRFIHLIRDPRQAANSMVKLCRRTHAQQQFIESRKGRGRLNGKTFIPYPRLPKLEAYLDRFGPYDVRTTAHLWNDGIAMVDENRPNLRHLYDIRYEDILADPRKEIFKLLEFCELPVPRKSNSGFWDSLNRIGTIHHTNTYGDFKVIETICRRTMQRHGFI